MTYADRYGAGPTVKPGSLSLALAATVLPLAALILGLQVSGIGRIKMPGPMEIFEVPKDPPPPPPDERTKTIEPPDTKLYVPPVPTPLPIDPKPMDITDVKPVDPPPLGPIGKSPDPAPVEPLPVKPPVIVNVQLASQGALQPPYPSDMVRAQQEGRVVVRVLVGADGRVKQIERVSATTDSFYAATERQALGKWRFKPATKDGVPFEQWKTMSLRFQLDGDQ